MSMELGKTFDIINMSERLILEVVTKVVPDVVYHFRLSYHFIITDFTKSGNFSE